jgi:phosphatidylserine/phosphatidylglycerophosphate/cardiolipin synthase-like enzyme
LPIIHNADLARKLQSIVRSAEGRISWEALGWTIETSHLLYEKWRTSNSVELLWSGPCPSGQIAARRIDQVLYDLISESKRDILLISFAAYKIQRLNDALAGAIRRGVTMRMIHEYEGESEKQLSFDAINAFPPQLRSAVTVYYWPTEKRERNESGRPGKLHAKGAIIDDCAVISSANLTDDAFFRNLELGALIEDDRFVHNLRRHFDELISSNILVSWKGPRV